MFLADPTISEPGIGRNRLSKPKRKKMYQDKEEKEPEARGLGAGSRMDFSLVALWTTQVTSYNTNITMRGNIFLPAKQSTTQQQSQGHTVKRKMVFCLDKSSASGNELDNKDPYFQPDPSPKRLKTVGEES